MTGGAGLAAVILRLVFLFQEAGFRRFPLYSLRQSRAIFCKTTCGGAEAFGRVTRGLRLGRGSWFSRSENPDLGHAAPDFELNAIPDDPDDNCVLECAVAGKADYIISRDRHLLWIGDYEGIAIVTVRLFLETAGVERAEF